VQTFPMIEEGVVPPPEPPVEDGTIIDPPPPVVCFELLLSLLEQPMSPNAGTLPRNSPTSPYRSQCIFMISSLPCAIYVR
jgi:hypothetical protein